MSGYYEVCRFNGAALTHVLSDGKTAMKTVCRLREFAGGKLAELWCGEEGKLVFCRYWRQPEFVPTLQGHYFHFFGTYEIYSGGQMLPLPFIIGAIGVMTGTSGIGVGIHGGITMKEAVIL